MCFDNDVSGYATDTTSKARKPRKCSWCNAPIATGELYVRSSGIVEGEFFHSSTCGVCELDRHRIHIIELSHGCRHHESWCQPDDLFDLRADYEIEKSSREDGQRWLRHTKKTGGHVAPLEAYAG